MPEATVTQETGTVETPVEVIAEVKAPTLAETEAKYRENFDKAHGRDITKMFPNQSKKEEVKVEAKTEERKEETKVAEATKVETTAPKPTSGIGRLKAKIARLEGQVEALTKTPAPVTTVKQETKQVTLVEPLRKDFATAEEWFTAVREYDKKVAAQDKQQTNEQRQLEQQQAEVNARYATFLERRDEFKKTHTDWDEVAAKAKVAFEPILEGVLIMADPEILYHFANNQKDARNINELSETSVVAVGNSDNITGVLKYLGANPLEIDKLNTLNPVKAQTFIGRIEAKIESVVSTTKDKTEDKRTSSGTEASPKTGTVATEEVKPKPEAKVEVKTEVKQDRVRPEPPVKVNGSAPSASTWTDPAHMSLQEREQLMREDPRYARRR